MSNKYPDSYVFPCVAEQGEHNYSVYFPDLPGCVSSGKSVPEAIKEAREALAFHLWGMEQDGDLIPQPSDFFDMQQKLSPSDVICYVDVNMFAIRSEMNNKPVKKTLTIPAWLNERAVTQKINFSRVLQNALMKELNVTPR